MEGQESPIPVQKPIKHARLIKVQDSKLYACTIGDMYPEGSLERDNINLRQVFYIVAKNASEAMDTLKQQYPDYSDFNIAVMS